MVFLSLFGISSRLKPVELQDSIANGHLANTWFSPTKGQLDSPLPNGELPLHFAVREGKGKVVQQLVNLRADPFQRDVHGISALDYAFNEEHSDFVPTLLQKAAKSNDTALSALKAEAHKRDPLNLSKAQMLLFGATCLQAGIYYAYSKGGVNSDNQELLEALVLGSVFLSSMCEARIHGDRLGHGRKSNYLWMGSLIGAVYFPKARFIQTPFSVWKTSNVVIVSLKGIQASYHSSKYRKMQSALCAAIHATNLVATIGRVAIDVLLDMGLVGDLQAVDSHQLSKLSDLERVMHKDLNPKNPQHALRMMNPSFTMEDLRDKGSHLFRKPFRKLAVKLHPDKRGSSEAATRLNMARDTLAMCARSAEKCFRNYSG